MKADTELLLEVTRKIHWQQAKGHLHSILETYYGGDKPAFALISDKIQTLIRDVEDHGLLE